jgi:hypothetical protein
MSELTITHNSGFFSCCSVRLYDIINFFNTRKRLPLSIDSSFQFASYKINPYDSNEDLNSLLFEDIQSNKIEYVKDINYHHNHQFTTYNQLDFENITPFIYKYFSLSNTTKEYSKKLEDKYEIEYDNTVSVFYRGNDKSTETGIASYDEFFNKCQQVYNKNKQIRFLIQTDEAEFRDEFQQNFKHSFFFEEMPCINSNKNIALQHIISPDQRPKFAQRILSVTSIVSQCKHLVTHSGNCGIWAVLLRGNATNVHQYLMHPDQGWV